MPGGQWRAVGRADPGKIPLLDCKGKPVWAPQYNIHKIFMGLVDMYYYAKMKKRWR